MASTIDIRQCINAISDVVNNRPRPLREFDQIFMKSADMLLQTDHISKHFDGRRVVFVGDGDAIALCLVHLYRQRLIEHGPATVHVLDFDERMVQSVENFATRFGIADVVTAELYNVADPLPREHWSAFNAFHLNPPFGASNGGRSISAFLRRASECAAPGCVGCIVLADHPEYGWTQDVLRSTQKLVLEDGFVIREVVPEFHHYHLDDAPDLTSCSMVVRRVSGGHSAYASEPLPAEYVQNFYGRHNPLRIRYVRDKTNGGKLASRDHHMEGFQA